MKFNISAPSIPIATTLAPPKSVDEGTLQVQLATCKTAYFLQFSPNSRWRKRNLPRYRDASCAGSVTFSVNLADNEDSMIAAAQIAAAGLMNLGNSTRETIAQTPA